VGTDPDAAAAAANAGHVVVAGLTSDELGENKGHVALVVIGTEYSGTRGCDLPRCVAGALNPVARVKDRGVQFSFPTKKAMEIRPIVKLHSFSYICLIGNCSDGSVRFELDEAALRNDSGEASINRVKHGSPSTSSPVFMRPRGLSSAPQSI
jgi:hypothetical protein